MADPELFYNDDMSESNELATEATVQTMIEDELATAIVAEFSDSVGYVLGNIVYYSGHYYKALDNILAGGGVPTANPTWEKKDRLEYATTATAASTTILTGLSAELQYFTGATTQNIQMPLVSTLSLGRVWYFFNKSSGIITIKSSGSNTIIAIPAGQWAIVTVKAITGTSEASWDYDLVGTLPTTGTSITLSSYLNEAKGSDIASATTTDIGAATGNTVYVTGTVTITGLGTVQAGTRRIVKFTDALTLTHNATSLILPSGANITTVAGDTATFVSLGSGNWICVDYQKVTWTGSGSLVHATSPTLVTPVLGVATATTINKVALTAPATGSTLTIADGKTLTVNNSLTLSGTDSTTHTLPSTSATIARTDAAQSFTGTQTFNNYVQLSENGGILMDQTLSADGKFSIIKGRIGTLGETISAVGTLVYYKASDSRWWRTDSDAAATSVDVPLALVCVTGNAGDDVQLMEEGVMRSDALFPTLTIGAPVYIGSSTGAVQVSKPTSGFIRVVGYGDTADALIFKPSNDWSELGTFSPTALFAGGSTGLTYSDQYGYFRKSKDVVHIASFLGLANKGSSTGIFTLANLPYTSKNATNNIPPCSLVCYNFNAIGVPMAQQNSNSTVCYFTQLSTAGANTEIANATCTNSTAVRLAVTYFV